MASNEESERLVLGRGKTNRPITAPNDSSLLVMGPPRSGRTTNFVQPNVSGWDGPCVVAGATPELIRATGERRKALGSVYIYDPTLSATGFATLPRVSWSPLSGCQDLDYAVRVAGWLTSGAIELVGGAKDSSTEQLIDAGKSLLGPLLYAAAWSKGFTMLDVCDWIETANVKQANGILETLSEEGEEASVTRAKAILNSAASRPEMERAAVFAALSRLSFSFREPGIRDKTLKEISIEKLVQEKGTLYLCVAEQDPGRTALLFTSLVTAIVDYAWSKAVGSLGVKVDNALLLVLDDVVRACPIGNLAAVAADGPHRGIVSVVTACDVSELSWRYGDENVSRTLGSYGAQVFLGGMTDAKTRQHISAHLEGRTKRTNMLKKEKESWVQLYRTMPAGHALLVRRDLSPAIFQMQQGR